MNSCCRWLQFLPLFRVKGDSAHRSSEASQVCVQHLSTTSAQRPRTSSIFIYILVSTFLKSSWRFCVEISAAPPSLSEAVSAR